MTKTETDGKTAMWDRLMPTDPKYTKSYKGSGGFNGTALNAMYVIRALTEEFGPCGAGWRFVLEDERIEAGHTLKSGDKAKLHIVRGHLEYRQTSMNAVAVDDPWFATSPQFGQTMLVGENKWGTFTDEDAPKKSITDCIGKCAATLGIGADIFLGLFDDNKYANERKQEEAAEAKDVDPSEHHKAPEAVLHKAAVTEQVATTTDDMSIARQVFALVKATAEKATDLKDIDDCLKHNTASLKVLERASSVNYDKLKALVAEERERIKKLPKNDPVLNDELPDFA